MIHIFQLANLDRWDDNQGVGVLATDDTGELRLLTGTGANYYVDQRRRNMGLQNLFNYIRRRAFRRSGERVREIDDANVPGLSVDQIQNMNFDRSLPERHQYLGDDMEVKDHYFDEFSVFVACNMLSKISSS